MGKRDVVVAVLGHEARPAVDGVVTAALAEALAAVALELLVA